MFLPSANLFCPNSVALGQSSFQLVLHAHTVSQIQAQPLPTLPVSESAATRCKSLLNVLDLTDAVKDEFCPFLYLQRSCGLGIRDSL